MRVAANSFINLMRNLAICFGLIAFLSVLGKCQIDTDFRNRLYAARPGIDMAAWNRFAQVPHRYSYRFALDNIPQMDILNKGGEVMGVTLTNGQAAPLGPGVIAFHPYRDCSSLAFATSVEGLQFDKVINAQDGLVKMNGHIGYANGGLATVRSTFAFTYIRINQQFNEQNVQICKKVLFRKKCHNEVHRHPRGLNHDEVNLVTQGAIWMTLDAAGIAFNGHNLQATPVSNQPKEFAQRPISSFKRIKGVKQLDIVNAIEASIGSVSSTDLTFMLDAGLYFAEYSSTLTSPTGDHTLSIERQQSGEFDITILTK